MNNTYEATLNVAIAELQNARSQLNEQIANYPTPISGCDAQFNCLLSDRTRITNALQALADRPFIATPRLLEPGVSLENR